MRFWKYQGIGNDFILLDGTAGDLEIDTEWCRRACDRHYGIGADGVLYVMPGEGTDITMRIINADGSEAEMCGNGIRCVAKYAADHKIVPGDTMTIHTLAGDLGAEVFRGDDGLVRTVRINMGAPILDGRTVPVDYDGRFIDQPFDADGIPIRANAVSMGNPHFITFTPLDDATVDRLGPILERHPFFPARPMWSSAGSRTARSTSASTSAEPRGPWPAGPGHAPPPPPRRSTDWCPSGRPSTCTCPEDGSG